MLIDNTFWIFDSHAKDEFGKSNEAGHAVLIKFKTINEIVLYFRQNFGTGSSYSLTEINFIIQTIEVDQIGDSSKNQPGLPSSYCPQGGSTNQPDKAKSINVIGPGETGEPASFCPKGGSNNRKSSDTHRQLWPVPFSLFIFHFCPKALPNCSKWLETCPIRLTRSH